jgi:hypothetical protein
MKVDFSSLVRTNLGFPSEWQGKSTEGKSIKISYRFGRTKVFCENVLVNTLVIDEFDIGGYMDDHVLKKLLKDNGYIEDDTKNT